MDNYPTMAQPPTHPANALSSPPLMDINSVVSSDSEDVVAGGRRHVVNWSRDSSPERPQKPYHRDQNIVQPMRQHSADIELHGPFSNCVCGKCMAESKKEAERRFTDETFTSRYIKKLEDVVDKLQCQVDKRPYQFGPHHRKGSFDSLDEAPYHPTGSIESLEDCIDGYAQRSYHPKQSDVKLADPPVFVATGDLPAKSLGPKLKIERLKKLHTDYGDPKVRKDEEAIAGDGPTADLSQKPVLTVTREFDRFKQFWRSTVDILSPAFANLLRDICHHDTDVNTVDDVLHLPEPFVLLFHNRMALSNYMETQDFDCNKEEVSNVWTHTNLILKFMRSEFGDLSRKLDDLESAEPSGLITYPELFLIYAPGTIVYTIENGQYEAFVVDSIKGMQKIRRRQGGNHHSHTRLDLTCWSMNYDGEVFGRVWSIHCLAPFYGTREISSLDLVPERFLPNANEVRKPLMTRGIQFLALQGQNYREYTGEVWSQHAEEGPIRVMVDHLTYQRRNDWPIVIDRKKGPSSAQSKNWRDNKFNRSSDRRRPRRYSPSPDDDPWMKRDYSPERIDAREERCVEPYRRFQTDRPPLRVNSRFNKYDSLQPTLVPDELTLLLCPQQVHGYCLRDKTWTELNITQLKPVGFRKNAWDRLVLDEEYKNIVQAMVSSYVDKSAQLEDLVAGKGNGLTALLHGPPGSGKTLTAECVAESFERPLYQVTCGDIGTDPERLECNLEEIFDYAVTWGAILLLDEADIFLQDRGYTSLKRNALVSIFLRTLEYFNGILFLTTNRVGTFDQAFQSRIHVTLGLPSLDQQRRTSVWAIFIADLAAKKIITAEQCDLLLQLVEEKWSKEKLNGRQIRNAVRTALVVAEKKKQMVGEKEFEIVLRIGREFEGYMGVLGKGEERVGLEGFHEVEMP